MYDSYYKYFIFISIFKLVIKLLLDYLNGFLFLFVWPSTAKEKVNRLNRKCTQVWLHAHEIVQVGQFITHSRHWSQHVLICGGQIQGEPEWAWGVDSIVYPDLWRHRLLAVDIVCWWWSAVTWTQGSGAQGLVSSQLT